MSNLPPVVDALADVTVFFALILALALLIERLLEVLKSFYDWMDSRHDWYHYWSRRAEAIAARLQRRLRAFEYLPPAMVRPVINRVYDLLLNNAEGGYSGNTLVISGDLVRASAVRLVCKVIGMGVGVVLALAFRIDFVQMWTPPAWTPLTQMTSALWATPALRIIVSGLAIGLGSGPVHKLITTIERKQREQRSGNGAGQ